MVGLTGTARIVALIIFILYAVVMLAIGIWARRTSQKGGNDYLGDFFTGNRSLGTLATGIMIGATMASAGTFIGTPAFSRREGLVWVIVISFSVFLNYNILGIIGKKVGIISRRIDSVSYIQLLKHRYNDNPIIGIAGPLAILIFLIPYCSSQFVGGARLMEALTGLPYIWGLIIFSVVIYVYAAFGGLKGVSTASIVQGFIMTIATIVLIIGVFRYINTNSGGLQAAYQRVAASDMGHTLSPSLSKYFPLRVLSFLLMQGIANIGRPDTAQNAFQYKDTKVMHNAIAVGMFFVLFWQVIMTWLGPSTLLMGLDFSVVDQLTPITAMTVLPPVLSGVIMAGAVGAIQSTVGGMLLSISSAAVKDLYCTYIDKNPSQGRLKMMTPIISGVILLMVLGFAVNPPSMLQNIINFAIGGLESAFFIPMLFGLYWWRANEYGGIASTVGGLVYYLAASSIWPALGFGLQPVFPASIFSCILMVAVSLITPKTPKGIIMTWFSDKYPACAPQK